MNANEIYTELLDIRNNSTDSNYKSQTSKYSENITNLRKVYRKEVAMFKENKSNNNLNRLMLLRKQLQNK